MEKFAAEQLIECRAPIRTTVRQLAHCFPKAPALSLCFTLASVASGLETSLGGEGDGLPAPLPIYRVIAVLAADILYLEMECGCPIANSDLISYWNLVSDLEFGPSMS